ncbi:alpha/beta-hydrolase [Dothidotthia symphoricarpi CBS 119687]|uniref:Alpha/beta-hydrolase n=1 Tax=Dothidotthia symphoricarpi CBS 119687 TaxID=1392245 RepID=A0A6A6A458_9PLEO|nr:alpha/beta-hydrolase [Dothidotthia symphoricarpi CBS 119687]KAF2125904.1 alpha/beta-hydrolase [Dothidotthia symphoricarpi CBS 119687]
MKAVTISLAALVVPLAFSLPTELTVRQTQPRVQINSAFYATLRRYTEFSVASLATFTFNLGKCPSPPSGSSLVRTIVNSATDTQVAIFQDDASREFIVSFSGTWSVQDFLTDFSFVSIPQGTAQGCTGCKAHAGFYVAWRSVADNVTTALSELRTQKPGYSTTITGHSLGGALASLAYTDLKAAGVPLNIAYTFGSPRVGNPAYADFTDKLSGASNTQLGTLIRVTHNTDGVPGLPSNAMGFQHTRTEIYELDDASGNQTPETTFRCFGQEAADCNKGTAMGFINLDHLEYTNVDMTNLSEDQCK